MLLLTVIPTVMEKSHSIDFSTSFHFTRNGKLIYGYSLKSFLDKNPCNLNAEKPSIPPTEAPVKISIGKCTPKYNLL